MSNIELLPCPFCGKKPDLEDPDTLYPSGIFWAWNEELGMRVYRRFKEREEGDQPSWLMHCTEIAGGCGVEIHGDTKEEALSKWNRRT